MTNALHRCADMDVAAWAERHEIHGSTTDLRCAFDDAATLYESETVAALKRDLQAALSKLRECRPVLVKRRAQLLTEADDWDESGDAWSASEAREEAATIDTLLASLPGG